MEDSPCITINSTVSISLGELRYRTTRSGGPGGQHVNK
jgi:protein subunit release factor B